MNFVERYVQMVTEQQTGVLEAVSGKRKWLFYFVDGALALTKSNLKGEQVDTLQAEHPNLQTSEIVLLQAGMRVQKACLVEEINLRSSKTDKNLNISALDALVAGISQAYSAEELSAWNPALNDRRPKMVTELSFSDGEIVAFISSLNGTLRSPVAISNSNIEPAKGWAVLWLAEQLEALEEDTSEPEEQINDLLGFDLDSLLEEEISKKDELPVTNAESAAIEEPEKSKEDMMSETLDELEHHILEAEHHFAVLGVSHEADPEEFRKSFRDLSMRLHPDRFVDGDDTIRERATTLFDKVREAYEVLSDEEARIKYTNQAIHGQKSEEEQAMEQLEAIWKADASFNKGKTLFNQGQISRAHPYFEEAAEASPETLEFVAYYGYTTFSINRNSNPEEATLGLETLKRVLELNKEQEIKLDSAWALMGRAYREKEEPEKAIRALKQALRINPSNPDALREMKRLTDKTTSPKKKENKSEAKPGFFSRWFGGKNKS